MSVAKTVRLEPILDIAEHLSDASVNEMMLKREHLAYKLDRYFAGEISRSELIDWAEYVVGFVVDFEEGYFELLNEMIHDIARMNVRGWELSDEDLRQFRERLDLRL